MKITAIKVTPTEAIVFAPELSAAHREIFYDFSAFRRHDDYIFPSLRHILAALEACGADPDELKTIAEGPVGRDENLRQICEFALDYVYHGEASVPYDEARRRWGQIAGPLAEALGVDPDQFEIDGFDVLAKANADLKAKRPKGDAS